MSDTPTPAAPKEKKVLGPRRYFCFEYQKDELEYLGFFADLKDCVEKTGVSLKGNAREHQWPLVETEVNRWIVLVRSHPEATAYFAVNYETGKLEYFGDFASAEAAIEHRKTVLNDPDESKYEILDTAKLRTWKTPSSEGEKIPLTPFSYDQYEKNAAAYEAEKQADEAAASKK